MARPRRYYCVNEWKGRGKVLLHQPAGLSALNGDRFRPNETVLEDPFLAQQDHGLPKTQELKFIVYALLKTYVRPSVDGLDHKFFIHLPG